MTDLDTAIRGVRDFNRYYTRTIGLLNETLTASDFTLTEARVLFELGHRQAPAAGEIARDLMLDPAYLARILRKFRDNGLVAVSRDVEDGRRRILALTDEGASALAGLQARSESQISALLSPIDRIGRKNLLDAMARIHETLERDRTGQAPVIYRPHRAGDVGWVIERQAQLYTQEYGWNIEFEALIAGIGSDFLGNFRPGADFCWVAERDGERLGAVFLVRQDDEEAKLRMLHVERAARGAGVGSGLVARCVEQAHASGYSYLTLWTNSVLVEARRLYQRAGFELVSEEPHHSFGKDLVGQYWKLKL